MFRSAYDKNYPNLGGFLWANLPAILQCSPSWLPCCFDVKSALDHSVIETLYLLGLFTFCIPIDLFPACLGQTSYSYQLFQFSSHTGSLTPSWKPSRSFRKKEFSINWNKLLLLLLATDCHSHWLRFIFMFRQLICMVLKGFDLFSGEADHWALTQSSGSTPCLYCF